MITKRNTQTILTKSINKTFIEINVEDDRVEVELMNITIFCQYRYDGVERMYQISSKQMMLQEQEAMKHYQLYRYSRPQSQQVLKIKIIYHIKYNL